MFVVHPELKASERGVHAVDIHADTSFLVELWCCQVLKTSQEIGSAFEIFMDMQLLFRFLSAYRLNLPEVAMSLVDSTAAFTLRCDEIDDTKQLGILLGRQGINTFSSLAFAIGTPNQPPTDAVFDQFAQRVFTLPSMGQTGKLRRLHFESQTYVLAQLKVAVSSDPSSGAKKLPVPEKQARIADLKHRLNGVVLEGEKEPAYSLIDLCQTIYDTGNIVWIHPSKCHKRDSEVKASVKDPKQIVKVNHRLSGLKTRLQRKRRIMGRSSNLCGVFNAVALLWI